MPVNDQTNDDFLEHYGIKGMRWGVRRKNPSGGSSSPAKTRTTYKKAPSALNDQELNRRIKRMELEKKYNDLNSKDLTPGRKYAQSILEGSGRQAVGAAVGGTVTFLVARALKKKFGS